MSELFSQKAQDLKKSFEKIKQQKIKLNKGERTSSVSKERFNNILSIITKAKSDGLKTNVNGKEITLDDAESLLKGIVSGKMNRSDFKKSTTILLMM